MILLDEGLPFSPAQPRMGIGLRSLVFAPNICRDISAPCPSTKKELPPLGVQATWGLETGKHGAASSLLRGGPDSASHPLPEQGFEFLLLEQIPPPEKMLFITSRDRELPRGCPGW